MRRLLAESLAIILDNHGQHSKAARGATAAALGVLLPCMIDEGTTSLDALRPQLMEAAVHLDAIGESDQATVLRLIADGAAQWPAPQEIAIDAPPEGEEIAAPRRSKRRPVTP